MIFVIGGIIVPLFSILIAKYHIVTAVRIVLIVGAIEMLIAIMVRNFLLKETAVGLKMKTMSMYSQYSLTQKVREALVYIIYYKKVLILLIIIILNNFQDILKTTYYNLYLISKIKISGELISVFTGFNAFLTLLAIFFVVPRLMSLSNLKSLLYGIILVMFSNLIFLFVAPRRFSVLIISILLNAVGMAIISPFLETCWANAIEDDKRANIVSYSNIFIMIAAAPFGAIGGYVYAFNPWWVFIIIFFITVIMFILTLYLFLKEKDSVKFY
jgi:Na+/melibiose symporter-like transporter